MSRFQFVDDHWHHHGVERLCQVIGLARSSYHRWKATAPDRAGRAAADARPAARIRVIHRESAGTDGVSRITAELHHTRHRVNHTQAARVMREVGLAGVRLRRRHRTTRRSSGPRRSRPSGPAPARRSHRWPTTSGSTTRR
ncbi:IS3 family transposase [Saccharothrix australiensis]|uniref:IS3 family transposase n=1 Tax=Saccharothrix australiensis TaxID=2072 RepID=UPI0014774B60|nr:IS3 family transposase [Saccharothrix australiensis]